MAKHSKYDIYDVVSLKDASPGARSGVILDYDFRRAGNALEVYYRVFTGAQKRWVRENEVRRVGHLPLPFDFDEPVTVIRDSKRRLHGKVTGMCWDPDTRDWGYTVQTASGRTLFASLNDVRKPGTRSDPRDLAYKALAKISRRSLSERLRRRRKILAPGTKAPQKGVYVQIGPAGGITQKVIEWDAGQPLPKPTGKGRAWRLVEKSEHQLGR